MQSLMPPAQSGLTVCHPRTRCYGQLWCSLTGGALPCRARMTWLVAIQPLIAGGERGDDNTDTGI
jgi:hypothetical protein